MNTKNENSECYGLDRASYNQGKNAKFDFSVEDNLCPPPHSKRTGSSLHGSPRVRYYPELVGAVCASDFKGIRNQDIDQEKYVVLIEEY